MGEWSEREREREQERGREEERESTALQLCLNVKRKIISVAQGSEEAIPVLDERVCRAWIIALSLFRSLFVLQCPWFYLQASKWEDRRTESFYKTTIPGRGDIWTPHNGWIEDKVLSYPTAVSEWYRYSSCFSFLFFAFSQVSACCECNRNVQKTNMFFPWCKGNGCFSVKRECIGRSAWISLSDLAFSDYYSLHYEAYAVRLNGRLFS